MLLQSQSSEIMGCVYATQADTQRVVDRALFVEGSTKLSSSNHGVERVLSEMLLCPALYVGVSSVPCSACSIFSCDIGPAHERVKITIALPVR